MNDGDAAPRGFLKWPRFPYPGLRPFSVTEERDESVIFFGRTENKDDVLDRLDGRQFVSIVGPSGCGKSSLVKVGVIPVLQAGLLTRAGSDWVALQMRPGQEPLRHLASCFTDDALPGVDDCFGAAEREQLLLHERSGLWLLMEQIAPVLDQGGRSRRVLLVLDQFEEIFSGVQHARVVDQFVGLITQFFRRPHPQLYVILTMRTDFIGQCANFPGLAEILNETQYITPVMRGQALRDAIVRPAEAYGGTVEPALVDAIMRDMGAGTTYDADHLPLMQHALLWLWQRAWRESGAAEPPQPGGGHAPSVGLTLTLSDYQTHGGIRGILNFHADKIFEFLESGGSRYTAVAEAMFRRLSERDLGNRYKRAPALSSTVRELAGCSAKELTHVVNAFAATSFVEQRDKAGDEVLLDVSHESLIRQWGRLRAWADAEADMVSGFARLASDAQEWDASKRDPRFLKSGGQLAVARDWWVEKNPNPAWASRYVAGDGRRHSFADLLPLVRTYLDESIAGSDYAHRRRSLFRAVSGASVLLVAALVTGITMFSAQKLKRDTLGSHVKSLAAMNRKESPRGGAGVLAKLTSEFLTDTYDAWPEVRAIAFEDLKQARETFVFSHESPLTASEFSPDGKWIINYDDTLHQLCLQPLNPGACVGGITPHSLAFMGGRWSRDGARILLYRTNLSGLWILPLKYSDGQPVGDTVHAFALSGDTDGHETRVGQAVFSPDGTRVAAGGDGQPFRLWSAEHPGAPLAQQQQHDEKIAQGFLLSLNKGSTLIAEGLADGGIDLYTVDEKSGEIKYREHRPVPDNGVGKAGFEDTTTRAIAFSPTDADILAISQGYKAVVLNVRTGQAEMVLNAISPSGARSVILNMVFSPDGTRIAAGDSAGLVRVWTYRPGHADKPAGPDLVGVFGGSSGVPLYTLAFNHAGTQLLATGRDSKLRVFNVRPALVGDPTTVTPPPETQPLHWKADDDGNLTITVGAAKYNLQSLPPNYDVALAAGSDKWIALAPPVASRGEDRKGVLHDHSILVYRRTHLERPVVFLRPWPEIYPDGQNVTWRSLRLSEDGLVAVTSAGVAYHWELFPTREGLRDALVQTVPKGDGDPDAAEFNSQKCLVGLPANCE